MRAVRGKPMNYMNKKGDLMKQFSSILIGVIALALLIYAAYLVINAYLNSEAENAKKTLDSIEAKYENLGEGQEVSFVVPGFNGGEKWYLLAFSKDVKARPEKCFFSNCLCICKYNSPSGVVSGSDNTVQMIADYKRSFSKDFFFEERVKECGSSNGFCRKSENKFVLQSTINYKENHAILVSWLGFTGGKQIADSPFIPIRTSTDDKTVAFELKVKKIGDEIDMVRVYEERQMAVIQNILS
jgi:hypothetical protein